MNCTAKTIPPAVKFFYRPCFSGGGGISLGGDCISGSLAGKISGSLPGHVTGCGSLPGFISG